MVAPIAACNAVRAPSSGASDLRVLLVPFGAAPGPQAIPQRGAQTRVRREPTLDRRLSHAVQLGQRKTSVGTRIVEGNDQLRLKPDRLAPRSACFDSESSL